MKQWQIITIWVAMFITLMLLSACTTTRYVEVPKVQERIVHQHDTLSQRDSIFVHDSITIAQRGDTVFRDRFHTIYRDRWRDKVRIDSFISRDTVTVVKEVEKPPSFWQKTQMQVGQTFLFLLLIGALGGLIFFLIRILIKGNS